MRIACIVGARPNFVKVAPIIRAMRDAGGFDPVLVHTGQHYDRALSDVFFDELDLPTPDFFLGVGSGSHAGQTAAVMVKFDELCAGRQFDRVLVVGDVNSTLACTITAAKRHIPVDHVEAGLRSFDREMPEEINRIVTDSIAQLLFVTEPAAIDNLRREGHSEEQIKVVGNVMIDTLMANLNRAKDRELYKSLSLARRGYGVVTLHRPSNVDIAARLREIVSELQRISEKLPLVFPVHPRTKKLLPKLRHKNVTVTDPLGYFDFLSLMEASAVVITDSGGIQEETTVLGVPCLTLRSTTERPVTVSTGTNTLIGMDPRKLLAEIEQILAGTYKIGGTPDLWDGAAAARIVRELQAVV